MSEEKKDKEDKNFKDFKHPMSIESFRKNGKEMIDYICDYYENLEKKKVKSEVKPGLFI